MYTICNVVCEWWRPFITCDTWQFGCSGTPVFCGVWCPCIDTYWLLHRVQWFSFTPFQCSYVVTPNNLKGVTTPSFVGCDTPHFACCSDEMNQMSLESTVQTQLSVYRKDKTAKEEHIRWLWVSTHFYLNPLDFEWPKAARHRFPWAAANGLKLFITLTTRGGGVLLGILTQLVSLNSSISWVCLLCARGIFIGSFWMSAVWKKSADKKFPDMHCLLCKHSQTRRNVFCTYNLKGD